jgi:uncharacterized protein
VIVVADTTPLNYLIQLQLTPLLEELYGEVYLPPAVVGEMQHAKAPEVVRQWAADLPRWITVASPGRTSDPELLGLHPGECEAIALAMELKAGLLLADDQPARMAAERRGIRVAGTLGILRDAANAGRIDFEQNLSELLRLGFRATSDVLDQIRAGLN